MFNSYDFAGFSSNTLIDVLNVLILFSAPGSERNWSSPRSQKQAGKGSWRADTETTGGEAHEGKYISLNFLDYYQLYNW